MSLDQPFYEEEYGANDKEMGFLDHLEALRWHIVRCVLAILIFACVAFGFINILFDDILMGPAKPSFWTYRMLCKYLGDSFCIKDIGFKIINTDLSGQFTKHIMTSLMTGVILGFPYILWELWRFVAPALKGRERKNTSKIVGAGSILFLVGLVFGYYFITPITVQFLGSYRISAYIQNYIDMESYLDTVVMMTFCSGIVFELPMIVFFLARAGILSAKTMRQYRRHAILAIIVLSAIITPGGDITSLLVLSIPFYILFEASIIVAAAVYRKRAEEDADYSLE